MGGMRRDGRRRDGIGIGIGIGRDGIGGKWEVGGMKVRERDGIGTTYSQLLNH